MGRDFICLIHQTRPPRPQTKSLTGWIRDSSLVVHLAPVVPYCRLNTSAYVSSSGSENNMRQRSRLWGMHYAGHKFISNFEVPIFSLITLHLISELLIVLLKLRSGRIEQDRR